MTDEENNINCTTTAANNKPPSTIIAEAAKYLLKNGLNGSNVAVAALFSATTLQLPAVPKSINTEIRGKTTLKTPHPPDAKLHETTNTTTATTTSNTMAAVTATSRLGTTTPPTTQISIGDGKNEMNVIDYTISSVHNINQKSSTNSSDIGRHPIASSTSGGAFGGGRLQFYKDGKFILELARSKDGEKGGWVSVPRKLFRSPSTTSSTVTPSSAITTAYPKNETSLSFSDDNSSIQSSPWQRDHCWKQITPRRGISQEMSLVFWVPKKFSRNASARRAAHQRRRRPLEPVEITSSMFDCVDETQKKSNDKSAPKTKDPGISSPENTLEEESDAIPAKNGIGNEGDGSSSSSSTATLTGKFDSSKGPASRKTPTIITPLTESPMDFKSTITEQSAVVHENDTAIEKMHTSEHYEDDVMVVTSPSASDELPKLQVNGHNNKNEETVVVFKTLNSIVPSEIETEGEKKRLKKIKIRAKLSSIIQKLINGIPSRPVQIPKTTVSGCNNGGINSSSNNSLAQKIFSPTSAAGASRLVEYHHPQHVSPRKRILREFEKVSLEDNTALAGGKRSRPKGNNASTSSPHFTNTKSPPNRVQSSGCTVSLIAASSASNILEEHSNNKYCSPAAKSEKSKSVAASVPKRLNSSYSIHSLLGGSKNNSTSSSVTSTNQICGEQAVVSFHNQQQQLQQHYTDPSYLRAMLASPKSPEGKLPSNYLASKHSPMHEPHSRSPTVAHTGGLEYGQRSPRETTPEHAVSYKMHSTSSQHNHHLQQHQGFYSPYMMSPKYVPAPSTSISPNSSIALSTRHPSAFNLTHSSSSVSAASSASTHIPNNFSSTGSVVSTTHREQSPPRSSTASPRESTPRTVPKKTASIRRRFASPTASTTNSSCTSPCERTNEEAVALLDRKSSSQHLFHRGSPSAPLGSVPYYLYPSQVNGASASVPSSIAAAATATYIPSVVSPPYYHPYISTLAALRHNPLWMHHYSSSGPTVLPSHHTANSSTACARLSPPFHSFAFPGVGAAVAAAAAAVFGGPQSSMPQPTHLPHHSHVFPQPPSALHGSGLMSTERMLFPKLTDNEHYTTGTTTTNANTGTKVAKTSASISHYSSKDESSLDVPLNLSKH